MPAYVVDPEKPMDVPVLTAEADRKAAFEAIRAAAIRAITTLTPQDVPPGTSEAAVPSLEREIVDLPSKNYFLKTLDRPRYPDKTAENAGR